MIIDLAFSSLCLSSFSQKNIFPCSFHVLLKSSFWLADSFPLAYHLPSLFILCSSQNTSFYLAYLFARPEKTYKKQYH